MKAIYLKNNHKAGKDFSFSRYFNPVVSRKPSYVWPDPAKTPMFRHTVNNRVVKPPKPYIKDPILWAIVAVMTVGCVALTKLLLMYLR